MMLVKVTEVAKLVLTALHVVPDTPIGYHGLDEHNMHGHCHHTTLSSHREAVRLGIHQRTDKGNLRMRLHRIRSLAIA
jgi:hypothetical protein